MDANEDLSHWRKAFPITTRSVYLNNNSLGAMPSGARDRLREYAKLWDERGVRAWEEGWWAVHDEIAALLAPILGVAAEQISLHQNVTMASAVFVSAIEFPAERNRIVFTDMNFPSLRYLYGGVARQRGAELVIVPTDDGIGVPTERLLEAIDERTALVPISHVLFRSAFIQDAPKIIRRAREVGAIVLLDVFQSAGTVPLALESWGCHAAVGGALKFLCGGPGACFHYVEEELGRELAPALSGWL
ncbi:MAG: aminotransferase class V-fold PLP-dependent enzyme, partial [Planctomycetota bacterium]